MNATTKLFVAYLDAVTALTADLGIPARDALHTFTPARAVECMNQLAAAYATHAAAAAAYDTHAAATPRTTAPSVAAVAAAIAPSAVPSAVQAHKQARVMGAAQRLAASQSRANTAPVASAATAPIVSATAPIPPFVGVNVPRQTGALPAKLPGNMSWLHCMKCGVPTQNPARADGMIRCASCLHTHLTGQIARLTGQPATAMPASDPVHARQLALTAAAKARVAAAKAPIVPATKPASVWPQRTAVTCVVCGKLTVDAHARCQAHGPAVKPASKPAIVAPITGATIVTGKGKPANAPVRATATNTHTPLTAAAIASQARDIMPGLERQGAIVAADTQAAPAPIPMQPANVVNPVTKFPMHVTAQLIALLSGMADQPTRKAFLANCQVLPGTDPSLMTRFTRLVYGK